MRYRSIRALENYKAELRAKGEKLTIAELIPIAPLNESNGMSSFRMHAGMIETRQEDYSRPMRLVGSNHALVSWQQPVPDGPWSANTWTNLIVWLETNAPVLVDIHADLAKPVLFDLIDYSVGYDFALPPNWRHMQSGMTALSTATLIELHENHPAQAWTNLLSLTRLVQRWQVEPIHVMHLTHRGMCVRAIHTTWEALQYPGWTDVQWAELQACWEALDLCAGVDAEQAMNRSMVIGCYAKTRQNSSYIISLFTQTGYGGMLNYIQENITRDPGEALHMAVLVPLWAFWFSFDDERSFMHRTQENLEIIRSIQKQSRWVNQEPCPLTNWNRRTFILQEVFDSGEGQRLRMATTETKRRMLVAAIALKRYQMHHGNYPEQLSALVPEFVSSVPMDFMDGQPLRYRLQKDGSYLLYSVAADGKDNGGKSEMSGNVSAGFKFGADGTDWVWPQPATPAECEAYNNPQTVKRGKEMINSNVFFIAPAASIGIEYFRQRWQGQNNYTTRLP